jgi:ubiquinone/menaquinone biosynthesis C-methylase UbiE
MGRRNQKVSINESQEKIVEHLAGIPNDAWLDSKKVYLSKKKHLELLGLLAYKADKILIIDAGAGPGTYGLVLAEQNNVEVIGVDISVAAIVKANERSFARKLPFHAFEGDLEHLPFKDGSFDIVFTGWTLHHFPSLDTVCSELCRILKPGGKLAIVEPNEANLMIRISRFIEDLLSPIILKIGWDTPNRTIHTYNEYISEFRKNNCVDISYSSCYAGLPPILKNNYSFVTRSLTSLYYLRNMMLTISTKILPRPLNGPDLLITGVKTH